MSEEAPKSIPSPELPIGSTVPIFEHSNRFGTSCPGLKGLVTRLDELNRPVEAVCAIESCSKKVPIDWSQIQLNREAKAAKKGKTGRTKKPAI
ncbi:MAG: hypothetical protein WC741_00590 [Patescibacteria group bacterium]|jgi:hypothetical protein